MRSRASATLSLTDNSSCSTVGIVSLLPGGIPQAHRVVSEAVTVGLFYQSGYVIVSNASERANHHLLRLPEHRRGRGSSRIKVGARRAGQSAGPKHCSASRPRG